jgi:hypothetical protein
VNSLATVLLVAFAAVVLGYTFMFLVGLGLMFFGEWAADRHERAQSARLRNSTWVEQQKRRADERRRR